MSKLFDSVIPVEASLTPSLARGISPEPSAGPERYMHECIRALRARPRPIPAASEPTRARTRPPPAASEPAWALAPTLTPGSTLDGRYRVIELLGRGGMGAVWRVHDLRRDRELALKTAALAAEDARRRRFIREARICSRIRHPNVVEILDVVDDSDQDPYYVMELLEGRDLAAILRLGCPAIPVAVMLLEQVANALVMVHRAGVVHRDIKPANVVVEESSTPLSEGSQCKLVDFGLAADTDADVTRLTRPGQFLGTPHYMSPEQIRGEPLDIKCDIYGFGCLAYELLAGAPPFVADDFVGLVRQHLFTTPRPLFADRPATAPRLLDTLEGLVGRCLAKEPHQRPGSMREVSTTLGAIGRCYQ